MKQCNGNPMSTTKMPHSRVPTMIDNLYHSTVVFVAFEHKPMKLSSFQYAIPHVKAWNT